MVYNLSVGCLKQYPDYYQADLLLSGVYTVSSITTECSQAATAAAPGVPEADGGEIRAAPETAAFPLGRHGLGFGPRR